MARAFFLRQFCLSCLYMPYLSTYKIVYLMSVFVCVCVLNDIQRIRIYVSVFFFFSRSCCVHGCAQSSRLHPSVLPLMILSFSAPFLFHSLRCFCFHIYIFLFFYRHSGSQQVSLYVVQRRKRREKKSITLDHSHHPVFETKKKSRKERKMKIRIRRKKKRAYCLCCCK